MEQYHELLQYTCYSMNSEICHSTKSTNSECCSLTQIIVPPEFASQIQRTQTATPQPGS
jgi:hypothetical protein